MEPSRPGCHHEQRRRGAHDATSDATLADAAWENAEHATAAAVSGMIVGEDLVVDTWGTSMLAGTVEVVLDSDMEGESDSVTWVRLEPL